MNTLDSLRTINSLVRTGIALVLVGAAGLVGWYGFDLVSGHQDKLSESREQLRHVSQELRQKQQEVARLADELTASQARVDHLETAMHLLKVDHRLAELRVLEQDHDPRTGRTYSLIEFVELTDDGRTIGEPKQFRIDGNKVYVDCWVVKFDDKYVEESDLDRSTSICLFRGIHGEHQTAVDAFRLDTIGTRPAAYSRGKPMSDFEKQIWADFWAIANDAERAREKGIRAAHGEDVYTEVREGMVYRLELRASDGMTIKPATKASPGVKPAT